MMKEMYWACADALTLGSQIGQAAELPPPEVLERRIAGVFDQTAERARSAGIPEEDITEARYALCAFLDEKILSAEWPGRQAWTAQPLQLTYFNENTAGEGFFQHLNALEATPRRLHVLQIYYLCLTLGFRGQYAVRGGAGLGDVVDEVGKRLSRALPPSDTISPRGEPAGAVRSLVRRELPLVAASVGVLVFSVVVFIVLRAIVGSSASTAANDMRNFAVRPTSQ